MKADFWLKVNEAAKEAGVKKIEIYEAVENEEITPATVRGEMIGILIDDKWLRWKESKK